MLEVWETSVRATHHFLKDGDIGVLKKIIVEKDVFSHISLTCLKDVHNMIIGIMGVSGQNLEMLFIRADFIGHGIGKRLLLHAINRLNITKVDVNEQNEQALGFYKHFGFNVTSRSEADEFGNPYPVLHMKLNGAD